MSTSRKGESTTDLESPSLEPPPSSASVEGFANLADLTLQSDILHLAENTDQEEPKLIKDLIFDSISLQQYDDDISQYSETAVKEAISSELSSLHSKNLFDDISSSDLIQKGQMGSGQMGTPKCAIFDAIFAMVGVLLALHVRGQGHVCKIGRRLHP